MCRSPYTCTWSRNSPCRTSQPRLPHSELTPNNFSTFSQSPPSVPFSGLQAVRSIRPGPWGRVARSQGGPGGARERTAWLQPLAERGAAGLRPAAAVAGLGEREGHQHLIYIKALSAPGTRVLPVARTREAKGCWEGGGGMRVSAATVGEDTHTRDAPTGPRGPPHLAGF